MSEVSLKEIYSPHSALLMCNEKKIQETSISHQETKLVTALDSLVFV